MTGKRLSSKTWVYAATGTAFGAAAVGAVALYRNRSRARNQESPSDYERTSSLYARYGKRVLDVAVGAVALPVVGAVTREMSLSMVLLPAPFPPMIPRHSPW